MQEKLQSVVVVLRGQVVRLRAEYRSLQAQLAKVRVRKGDASRERAAELQARLSYLVPMLRALEALRQQTTYVVDLGQPFAGRREYLRAFEKLRRFIRAAQYVTPSRRRLFGQEELQLSLLVPKVGIPLDYWPVKTLAELVVEAQRDLSAERQAALECRRHAEAMRAAFLASLTSEQRGLLAQALEAAKAKGSYAVSFDQRDLVEGS